MHMTPRDYMPGENLIPIRQYGLKNKYISQINEMKIMKKTKNWYHLVKLMKIKLS